MKWRHWDRACRMLTDAGYLVDGKFDSESTELTVAKKNGVWLSITLPDFSVENVEKAIEELAVLYDEHNAHAQKNAARARILGLVPPVVDSPIEQVLLREVERKP